MDFLRKNRLVIVIVIPIVILVLIRSVGTNHFKSDANRWAEPSVSEKNIISVEQLATFPGEKLIINLDDENSLTNDMRIKSFNIPADSILSKNYLKIIREHEGTVLLVSEDPTISARIWMVISQMGYNNIYIITNDTDNEVFKYKFRPDTLVRPEL